MHAQNINARIHIPRTLAVITIVVASFMALWIAAPCAVQSPPVPQVLIVADEFPAMQVLADRLQAEEKITGRIVTQREMPAELTPFAAVIVYIHKDLDEAAETAFIRYAESGGKLILLHHSISSGKRKNKAWFTFLGVELPQGDVDQGGYKYQEGITLEIVNINPGHFITAHKMTWPERSAWIRKDGEKKVPAFTLHETEVYLNHVLKGPRTILLGFKYADAKTGKTWTQTHAGWIKTAGKGTVVYLMPGHSARDFKDPAYGRIVLNAVIYKK